MKLSIIIPVYNEEKTVAALLEKVSKVTIDGVEKEIIIVDDGSTDASASKISQLSSFNFKFIKHKKNQGKGAAVRTGLKKATGEYVIIQDADLEYNPQQIAKLIKPVVEGKAEIVYGTRLKRMPNFKKDERNPRLLLHYVGNKFLSLTTSVLYLQWITDMETCYKLFPKKTAVDIILHARGFEFEPEITAKFLKKGCRITEIPITTIPRLYSEGKKLNTVRDGIRAFWTLVKYRFTN